MTAGTAGGGKQLDPFFEFIPDADWNACVGKQGYEENYVDGYMEAAQRMVALVMDGQLMASRDTLVLPILYNARHGIELALKFAINRLHDIGAVAARHRPDHDILSHWLHLSDAKVGDEGIRRLVAGIEPYVVSLAGIDDDGQELRYAQDQSGKKSLDQLAVVNLALIRTSLEEVGQILQALKNRVVELHAEHATGTYTNRCSRTDLKEIARMAGPRAAWGDPTFDGIKLAIRARFDLGSRELSKALDAVQKSRELATLISVETPLRGLEDDKAAFAIERWAEAHPPSAWSVKDMGVEVLPPSWDEMQRGMDASRAVDDAWLAGLSVEEISDLEALFYVGRESEFGEHYEGIYESALKKNRLETRPLVYVHHLTCKVNLLDAVARGCEIAGRPSLAERLRALAP